MWALPHSQHHAGDNQAPQGAYLRCAGALRVRIRVKPVLRQQKTLETMWFQGFRMVRGTGLEPVSPCTSSMLWLSPQSVGTSGIADIFHRRGATRVPHTTSKQGYEEREKVQEGNSFLTPFLLLSNNFSTTLNQLSYIFVILARCSAYASATSGVSTLTFLPKPHSQEKN